MSDTEVKARVRFFGKLADAMGQDVDIAMGAPFSIAELRSKLVAAFPALAAELARPTVRACVDQAIVPDDFIVETNSTVEFLPTVSGG